ncbi:MAG: phage holin family protein [Planctomycetaceae bacterium]
MNIQEQRKSVGNGRAGIRASQPGLGSLVHDLIALLELQGRLFVHDLHQLRTGSGPALLMLAFGLILAFATVPVLLLGLGWMLADFVNWPVWAATIVVAFAGGVGPALLLLLAGWKVIQRKAGVMSRSTTELRCNSDWLKRRLKSAF